MAGLILFFVIVVLVFVIVIVNQLSNVNFAVKRISKIVSEMTTDRTVSVAKSVDTKIVYPSEPQPTFEPTPQPIAQPNVEENLDQERQVELEEVEIALDAEPWSANPIEIQPEPQPVPVPVVVPAPVKKAPVEPKKSVNYEKYIGENLFGKIGILVLVIGVGLFVKYAIDNNWLNETMRTILGFAIGLTLLFIGQRLEKRYRTFSSLLAGGAFAIFYLTVAIAYHQYGLFSQTTSFIILVAITAAMSALSILYNRRELAIISLVGGFVAPFLVSSGSGSYISLFSYIAILNLGMFFLSLRKKWSELPVICFCATYIIMGAMNAVYGAAGLNYNALGMLIFATVFYIIFILPVVAILRDKEKINRVLFSIVVSNNFVYLAFALVYVSYISTPIVITGVVTLFVAAVNLAIVMWLMRHRKDMTLLVYAILGIVLSFVSLTIPLQLDGNYITLFWATEMVLLLWLFVKSKINMYNYFALAMIILSAVSLIIDFVKGSGEGIIFINSYFATNIYTAAAFLGVAYMLSKYRDIFASKGILKYNPINAIMLISGGVAAYITIAIEFSSHIEPLFIDVKVVCLFTIVYMLLAAFAARKRFAIDKVGLPYILAMALAMIVYLSSGATYCYDKSLTALFNSLEWATAGAVIAFLSYVSYSYFKIGELKAQNFKLFMLYINILATILWMSMVWMFLSQINLDQHSAGVSVALFTIGTAQMILGMKLHIRLLRIIGVVVISIVIVKLMLVDMWMMNTAGRIVVFISFGAILLALSFLYQKLRNVLFAKDEK